jgi:hypothetical protein
MSFLKSLTTTRTKDLPLTFALCHSMRIVSLCAIRSLSFPVLFKGVSPGDQAVAINGRVDTQQTDNEAANSS